MAWSSPTSGPMMSSSGTQVEVAPGTSPASATTRRSKLGRSRSGAGSAPASDSGTSRIRRISPGQSYTGGALAPAGVGDPRAAGQIAAGPGRLEPSGRVQQTGHRRPLVVAVLDGQQAPGGKVGAGPGDQAADRVQAV